MRIERDTGGIAGEIVELPQLGVAPVPVVRRDVFNLLCRALALVVVSPRADALSPAG